MNEESILKRTLLLTGKLLGIFSIWVALVSFLAVAAASRMVSASGPAADKGAVLDTTKTDEGKGSPVKSSPVTATSKPNG